MAAYLTAPITAVTVYRDGARVRREVELRATEGRWPDEVRVGGLPLSLVDTSLRASVEHDGTQAVRAVSLAVKVDVRGDDPLLAESRDPKLVRAEAEVASVRGRLERRQAQLARLDALRLRRRPRPPRGAAPPASPTEARLELLGLREEHAQRLGAAVRALEVELGEAVASLAKARAADDRSSSARRAREHELRKCVVIRLEGETSTEHTRARLRLEYRVPGARWAPAYSVHLDRELRHLRLGVRALVCQRTDEDWRAVELTLSTAAPETWCELERLGSLRIGRAQPAVASRGWRPPPTGASELYGDYDRVVAAGDRAAAPLSALKASLPPEPASPKGEAPDAPERARVARAVPIAPPPRAGTTAAPELSLERAPRAAAPPLPFAASAPRSITFQPQALPRKSAGVGAFFGTLGGHGDGVLLDEGSEAELAASKPTLVAVDELLDYDSLRMPAADDAERGVLKRVSREELYLELMVEQRVSIQMTLVAAIEAASERAHAIPPPPARHRWPASEAGYDYAYVAEAPLDVPSDGQYHSVPLLGAEGPAQPVYVVVPRESTDVFRVVTLMNPLAAAILDGPADVYVAGRYATTADLKHTPPRGKLRLGLGVEQGIKVARNCRYEEQTEGLMRGSLALEHEVRIEIRNQLSAAARVEVRERIPVAREGDEDVAVMLRRAAPEPEAYEPEGQPLRGGYSWALTVGAGEEANVEFSYAIRIPSKLELAGGNRRER